MKVKMVSSATTDLDFEKMKSTIRRIMKSTVTNKIFSSGPELKDEPSFWVNLKVKEMKKMRNLRFIRTVQGASSVQDSVLTRRNLTRIEKTYHRAKIQLIGAAKYL